MLFVEEVLSIPKYHEAYHTYLLFVYSTLQRSWKRGRFLRMWCQRGNSFHIVQNGGSHWDRRWVEVSADHKPPDVCSTRFLLSFNAWSRRPFLPAFLWTAPLWSSPKLHVHLQRFYDWLQVPAFLSPIFLLWKMNTIPGTLKGHWKDRRAMNANVWLTLRLINVISIIRLCISDMELKCSS